MRKLIFFTPLLIAGVFGLLLVSYKNLQTSESEIPAFTKTFTGKITNINNGCRADGFCSITVDGSKHVLGQIGGVRSPEEVIVRGESEIDFSQDNSNLMGKAVAVFAEVSKNGYYTIYGSQDYYIRLLDE